MIPCKLCIEAGHDISRRRGLKQVGKTKFDGPRHVRKYRCLDCGAVCLHEYVMAPTIETWVSPAELPSVSGNVTSHEVERGRA